MTPIMQLMSRRDALCATGKRCGPESHARGPQHDYRQPLAEATPKRISVGSWKMK